MRYTFAYIAGLNNIPLTVVRGVLGHMTPEMTKHYTNHASKKDKAKYLEQLPNYLATKDIEVLPAQLNCDVEEIINLVEDMTALPQTISCSRSFASPVFELKYLQEAVSDYASKAAFKLRESKQLAAGAQVYIQYYPEYNPIYREGGFKGVTVRFEQPTAATGTILNSLLNALPKLFIKGRRYKKAGVVFFELSSIENVQE